MRPRLPQQPTVQQVLDAFDGHFYAPADSSFQTSRQKGWGRDADGHIDHLSISFESRARERIIVEMSQSRHSPQVILLYLTIDFTAYATPRFPITIDRARARIEVEGRERTFTTYAGGSATVAVAKVGGYELLVRCKSSRLRTLSLAPVDHAQLLQALQA